MISIVVPCYNQGRFLTDCLESVALQTRPPGEVLVVNDGSTDAETNALCARLPQYSYPFPLRVIVQENRGLPAARNTAIRQSRGDVILPLDSDDKLLPEAVEEYERFFAANPDIDVCYPDVLFHGTLRWNFVAPLYNVWRHLQHNWFVPCTAIRRRVFAEGHEYWEEMRRGYEDWEFWLRTCVLGPYRAAALCRRVFAYRKWGFSMLAATQHDEQIALMHRRHAALGLWSRAIEARLRTRHAPSHLWLRSAPLPAATAEDVVYQPLDDLESALRGNAVSRFLWFGEAAAREPAALRFLVSRMAEAHCAPLYVFLEENASTPYLIVLDRVAVLEAQRVDIFSPTPVARAVLVHTRGDRHPWPASVRVEKAWPVPASNPLTPLQQHPARPILPADVGGDPRREADVYYFFRRDLDPASLPHPEGRVLVLALPDLTAGPAARQVRALLAQPALRERFDATYLLTFDPAPHDAHTELEPLTDGIYHLGAFGLEAERKLKLLEQFLTETEASDLLLYATPALEIIPRLRISRRPVRITASFPAGERALPRDALHRLASEYANLVDRVVTESDEQTLRLVDHLYFPATKVRALPPGAGAAEARCWAEEMSAWLFPREERPRDHLAELFGLKAASRAA